MIQGCASSVSKLNFRLMALIKTPLINWNSRRAGCLQCLYRWSRAHPRPANSRIKLSCEERAETLTTTLSMNMLALIAITWIGKEYRFLGLDWSYLMVLGFIGNALFSMRFLVQWIASERQRESVIP